VAQGIGGGLGRRNSPTLAAFLTSLTGQIQEGR
jgi:hypothetical protein